jgi:hypothetical protein
MTPAATNPAESREHDKAADKAGKPLIIVDLGEPQSSLQVRRLRKGKGKLFSNVERIISDLTEAGTLKSSSQPVVIVVREAPSVWPFDADPDDD